MKIDAELFDLCKDFIKENGIGCAEDIYQGNHEEQILELLEQICELVGYHEEEDQEELDFEDEE